MELRHLRYFVAVAETGNLSRAAEKLFIAQPPLSLQIRQLEEALGEPLFIRHPKGVRLTAAGQALLPEARSLLDRAARLGDLVQQRGADGAGLGGTFSLGYVPSASSTLLPELVRALRQLHPRLNLSLRELISDEQTEALVAGQIDAGIARTNARHARISVACQMPDPFCLAFSRAAAPRAGPALDLRRYAQHGFVAFTRHRGPAYFDQAVHLCGQAGFSPVIRYEASTVRGVLDLVGAGLGVALVPASASLLGVAGVLVRPLRASGTGEVLALLRRKVDNNPLLPVLQQTMVTLFAQLQARTAEALQAK